MARLLPLNQRVSSGYEAERPLTEMLAIERIVDLKRILLVCSGPCRDAEERFHQAGCYVTKVDGGRAAVDRARREALDAVVLMSTGREMDMTETVLNLRDINPSLQIIIIVAEGLPGNEASQREVIAHAIPKVTILAMQEVGRYLASAQWTGEPVMQDAHRAGQRRMPAGNRHHK